MNEAEVIVEVPTGSRNKYELDKDTGRIMLDRTLFTSMSYPADYGFIDGTLGEDGDPLDALVLVTEATFPGCGIRVKPVGVFHMTDEKGPDEKIICVPLKDPRWSHVESLDEIPAHLLKELEHFFRSTASSRERSSRRTASATAPPPSASSSKRVSALPAADSSSAAVARRGVRSVRLAPLAPVQLHEGADQQPERERIKSE